MKIPKTQLNRWSELRDRGDIKEIVELFVKSGRPITRQTVARVLELGKCDDKYFPILKRFFDKKEKMYSKLNAQ